MLSFKDIKSSLLVDLPEHKFIKLIQKLSQNFTTKREDISIYESSAELVSAYSLFYFPTNYKKLAWTIEKIGKDFYSPDLEFIDIGMGPATFLHALKDEFQGHEHFLGIDHSSLMCEQAKIFWKKAFGEELKTLTSTKSIPKKNKPRFLIFGHSLNEMGFLGFKKYFEELDPDYILFIEPGTKALFSEILSVRDFLLEKKFNILYPCQSGKPCPMRGSDDWCHQYVITHFEPEIERLTQLTGLNRRHMPLIMHFYSKNKIEKKLTKNCGFITRTYPETKFSVEFEICMNEFQDKIIKLEFLKRDLDKNKIKELLSLNAGDSISFSVVKEITEAKLRAKP